MNGVLLIDKPSGPTSHDVVSRLRRATGERSIGHTGTLDPRATGLLPLVLGRATRLASLLSTGDKTYEATIRLGFATDTDDADGQPLGTPATTLPGSDAVEAVLDRFRGTFQQIPPRHSAKKIAGRKAYELARRAQPVELAPVAVTVTSLERLSMEGPYLQIRVAAESGFYVRALARDLGEALGCAGHLHALRRTRSGGFSVADAIPFQDAERLGRDLQSRVIPAAEALPHLPCVRMTASGLTRAMHGNPIGPADLEGRWIPPAGAGGPVRLLAGDGRLVALAHSRGGALHPVTVLG
jgi:tRNA pseudouridine55 synthase